MAAHIRNFLSGKPFVITGVTHSLGNDHFLGWALQNNANGIDAADCLICTTPTAQAVVESAFAHLKATQPDFRTPSTVVIPLGIAPEAFSGDTAVTRQQLGLTEDDFVILSFGRFNHQFKMDILPLLSLAALLEGQSRRPIRLLLAGSADNGVYAAFVQEQAKLNGVSSMVRVLPNIGETQKAGLFRTADVFLSLSDNIQETFGLTVVEALAAGLPVVASDWNGYKALVRHEVTGFLVPTKTLAPDEKWEASLSVQPDALTHMYCAQTTAIDLPAACANLVRLAEDRDLAERMGRAAAASAAQYDWSAVIRRYVELWARLRTTRQESDATGVRGVRRSGALRFLADFAGYAGSELSLDDRFITSNLGRRVIERQARLSLYEHMEPVLDLQIMTHVLQLFLAERTLGDVARDIQREFRHEPLRVCQNVLWLYKYGFLQLS
jgi:glycosyltransferase involved in cell wall biosynthesis